VDTIRWANDLDLKATLKPGQTIKISPVTGVVHKVKKGDTVYSLAKYYQTDAQAIVDYPFNTFVNDEAFELAVGQVLIIPDGVIPKAPQTSPQKYIAQQTPNAGTVVASGNFVWPTSGRISQGFRWYHQAIDIANKAGTTVLAADSGKVTVAGWLDNTGYGNRVVIDHGNGFTTLYGHFSKVLVSVGQTVNRGDPIGLMGSTGRSTGPHLHFEIRVNGQIQDPLAYLK
jgi:murein DD-endopeptidase MepM/ murein hydrolase activator NlpD